MAGISREIKRDLKMLVEKNIVDHFENKVVILRWKSKQYFGKEAELWFWEIVF